MIRNFLKKILLLAPVAILFCTLLFLNHTTRVFKDTAFEFVYDTNVQTVQSFSSELAALSSQGFSSDDYSSLYINMIHNFNNAVGDKEAIVTFMTDEYGHIHHSNDHNREYLSGLIEDEGNMGMINATLSSDENGAITLERRGAEETLYHHRFYSGDVDYRLFMCVERQAIDAQVDVNAVIIPISFIGLLLFLTMEYVIWLKMERNSGKECAGEKRGDDAD